MRKTQAARLGTLEQLFKAMADQTRLRILALLAGGEVCVCDIHETLGIPQPRASRHLAYLRRTGLVLESEGRALGLLPARGPGRSCAADAALGRRALPGTRAGLHRETGASGQSSHAAAQSDRSCRWRAAEAV